jgi:hypothetical protein
MRGRDCGRQVPGFPREPYRHGKRMNPVPVVVPSAHRPSSHGRKRSLHLRAIRMSRRGNLPPFAYRRGLEPHH